MKFGLKEKILAGLGGVVIIIALWYFLFYSPQQNAIAKLERETEEILNKISRAQSSSVQISQLKSQIEELTKELNDKQSQLVSKDSLTTIETELRKLAAANNLTIESLLPNQTALFESDSSMVVRFPITISMKGKFFDFGKFLEDLRFLPFLIKESEVAMKTDDSLYPDIVIVLKLFGYVSNIK